MTILAIDDSAQQRTLLKHFLKKGGFTDVVLAATAEEGFEHLGFGSPDQPCPIDLILMDILMPRMNGIEACQIIKEADHLRDIPIIMVTGMADLENLELAFKAGAIDYIIKPLKKIELLARVRSSLRLKHEMDLRKAREKEVLEVAWRLEEANRMLQRLSFLDGLTGIANRRYFDECLDREWKCAARDKTPLSLVLVDVDKFKSYNDTYGHQQGDKCLKEVARGLGSVLKRPGDFFARYGGEEFAAVLRDTDLEGGIELAQAMCRKVQGLGITHACSTVCGAVTVSIGVAALVPSPDLPPTQLIEAADQALYEAKQQGRNQVRSM